MKQFKVIYTLKNGTKKEFVHDESYREEIEHIKKSETCFGIQCSKCPYDKPEYTCVEVKGFIFDDVENFEIIDLPQFKVGSKVRWCGADGIVIPNDNTDSIYVNFKYVISSFSHDGRYFDWQEPSLELIERAKIKEPKRYWQWKIKDKAWYKNVEYLDDKGFNTDSFLQYDNWDEMEKQKIEDDYIEV